MGSLADLAGKRVYLDANVFIYALGGLPPWQGMAQAVLGAVEGGNCAGVTSELTLAECLVRPLQLNVPGAIDAYQQSIRSRRQLTVVPVSREVLIEAARVRATSPARLPDAIHIASYRLQKADVFVTNDQRLKTLLRANAVLLSELALD